ncbi:helix-turn-helix domain-containing protein [Pseudoclavibacter chungangensis]|uniref:Helix-turn-helix domain-containing protein n=1 Tax=Pseudoclavibacter chungangensis TaxID=587635 RepID=A0A7J5BRG1_9MICO|nr:XRE family transcriptional regulator [Pseudoclavibacter chungangensis]KAB1656814.1 helix-turn-helix domain-containing protein [Pseudoclavibacter chungangensis]NYJ67264.1 transcriptional regulator with XRE-family HTH domain [Pseudoclavibacter chungangensis]
MDGLVLGRRIRYYRKERGLTLEALSERTGLLPSRLSLIENGKREPKLSVLQQLADAFEVDLTEMLSGTPPDERSRLEIDVERAQRSPAYEALGLPHLASVKTLPDEVLTVLRGLHRELDRRVIESTATPEEARRANTELRLTMRERNNAMPEIDAAADQLLSRVDHTRGALSHHHVAEMAKHLGFTLIYVDDLPGSTRSITDLENGRIYLPPASIPGGHGLRAMALQAMAHRVLGHRRPTDYADFLRQRLEINYFAASCLMPLDRSVAFLQDAKDRRDMAVEDFRDAFGVTHEAAALRMTNLLTEHLGISLHMLRVDGDGAISRVYENDGLPLPVDVTGSIEGQFLCRKFSARQAFANRNRTTETYQYTDTPAGTFWCSTQTGTTAQETFSITIGVPFDEARWFRGRNTKARAVSTCPDDEQCCRAPEAAQAERWTNRVWPSARVHARTFSPLPTGDFPGVDQREVFEFLERHDAGSREEA